MKLAQVSSNRFKVSQKGITNMNIKYPRLVEDAFEKVFKHAGKSKAETYRLLLEKNFINEDGTPTAEAIKNGFVALDEKATLIEEQKRKYPIFRQFDDEHFIVANGHVYVDDFIRLELARQTLRDPHATGKAKEFARKEIEYLDR